MVITKINNLHIHNSNSQCCWNRYPIKLLYAEAKHAGLQYCGSTNHINPPHNPPSDEMPVDVFQRHLQWTKEEIEALPIEMTRELPIYLGAELNIEDDKSPDYFLPEYKELVDYWIAGMHTFFKESYLKDAYNSPDKKELLNDYFDEWGSWVVNYIEHNRPDILVHPFWQELEVGIFEEIPMNACFTQICETAANYGTAIECSSLQFRSRRPREPFWSKMDVRGDHFQYFEFFYRHLFEIAKENNCMISFGSDAHSPEIIKDVGIIKNFLESLDFEDKDIFEPIKK
jgi:histidinol phosphatase-like PHP family hydrolase